MCLYPLSQVGDLSLCVHTGNLNQALAHLALPWEQPRQIRINCGEICESTALASSPVTNSMTASCFATAIPCTGGRSIQLGPPQLLQ